MTCDNFEACFSRRQTGVWPCLPEGEIDLSPRFPTFVITHNCAMLRHRPLVSLNPEGCQKLAGGRLTETPGINCNRRAPWRGARISRIKLLGSKYGLNVSQSPLPHRIQHKRAAIIHQGLLALENARISWRDSARFGWNSRMRRGCCGSRSPARGIESNPLPGRFRARA